MEQAELTGMPMKDFFDWTTSPSGILAIAEETTETRNSIYWGGLSGE